MTSPDALLRWWLPNGWDHAGGWLGHHHWGMFWILLLHHGLHRPSDSQSLGCQTWLQCLQWNSLLHPALCWQRLNPSTCHKQHITKVISKLRNRSVYMATFQLVPLQKVVTLPGRPRLLSGMFAWLYNVLPACASGSILVFVGLLLGRQAFEETPPRH